MSPCPYTCISIYQPGLHSYLSVDPELVEQVQLNVNGEDGGRRHQSQRQVENLKKKKDKV